MHELGILMGAINTVENFAKKKWGDKNSNPGTANWGAFVDDSEIY